LTHLLAASILSQIESTSHLFHFCSLYRPYLPPVDVIPAVPVVIIGDLLLLRIQTMELADFFPAVRGLRLESP